MTQPPRVVAVDILIEPGTVMRDRAAADNAELRTVYPTGFALDDLHRPHVTLAQVYVTANRMQEMFTAVAGVLDDHPCATWSLTGTGYYYLPWGELGVAGIVVEPTDALVDLQRAVIEAARPCLVAAGDASAYVTSEADPGINQPTLDYVAAFVETQTGEHYNPHVTIGVATREHLDALVARPFEPFSFGVDGIAAYQLGNLGVAARLLHSWSLVAV